ncbi:hypothetical protein PCASD_06944 [Puccinia coronata f. sp. avenae]|uniref:Uncharacterized protein n=1 Tax=Puccinia coronata f. sp. avenae TaxID=200324 RepID=A0A2N5V4V8_9BASI|nr:hypothetical protein PCASD_23367 [Puccinia coronata f. sp. avenae]PLW45029.1 hypothetical protein PCASD_06944 [Puccinia coronata f. sp. avenae]
MFSESYTSLEVLALHSMPFSKKKPAAIQIPFDRLHLQQLELHYTPNHAPPRGYERSCARYGVKCLYIEDADAEHHAQSNDHILASSLARITL